MPSLAAAYQYCIDICNDNQYLYSMDYRNKQTIGNYTYFDCASLMNYSLLAGGWETPSYAPNYNATTTWTLPEELARLGWYEVGNDDIQPGDIGITNDDVKGVNHTEMCYSGGSGVAVYMGAHGQNGIAYANQVSIGSSSGDATATKNFYTNWRCPDDCNDLGGALNCESKYSLYVIAAICGNLWAESRITPNLWEEGKSHSWTSAGVGYGIAQWTNSTEGTESRLYHLYEYMTEKGSIEDGNIQVDYLAYDEDASVWSARPSLGYDIATRQDFLDSDSTDLEYLTGAWCACWERPAVLNISTRLGYAQQCYDYIAEHASDSNLKWCLDTSNNEAGILNNAVLVYQRLSGTCTQTTNNNGNGASAGELTIDWYTFAMALLGFMGHGSQDMAIRILRDLKRR